MQRGCVAQRGLLQIGRLMTTEILTREQAEKEAVILRQRGLTYKAISEQLGGVVSVDWAKRNLKGIKPASTPTPSDPCVDELISLATRPEGCTDYEARGVIYKHNEGANSGRVSYLKRRARKKNKACLFRPDWIDTSQPSLSHKAINAYALHLQDEVDRLVMEYVERFTLSSPEAVKYELLKLSHSDIVSKEPLSKRVQKNEEIAEELEIRLREDKN